MCEGYSLELGLALRGAVVRHDRIGQPSSWLASLNAGYLGEFLDRDLAMGRVEDAIEQTMEVVHHDWELYQAAKRERTKSC
jgi:hypothetical protein